MTTVPSGRFSAKLRLISSLVESISEKNRRERPILAVASFCSRVVISMSAEARGAP